MSVLACEIGPLGEVTTLSNEACLLIACAIALTALAILVWMD